MACSRVNFCFSLLDVPDASEPGTFRQTTDEIALGGGRFGGRMLKFVGPQLIVINHRVLEEAVAACNFINKGRN